MADTKFSALSAVTVLANVIQWGVDDGGTSKRLTLEQVKDWGTGFWIRQAASRTLTSTTTEQKLFDSVANGTLTLPTGVYYFDCQMYITGMSATSGNLAFDILGAGTGVLADILYHAIGIDGLAATAAAQTGSTSILGQSVASIVSAVTATGVSVSIRGSFEVTTAGTIIPSVTLVTAAAATVAAGTYFRCERWGAINAVSQGPWS